MTTAAAIATDVLTPPSLPVTATLPVSSIMSHERFGTSWLEIVWMTGVLVLLAHRAIGAWQIRRLAAMTVPYSTGSREARLCQRLTAEAGVRRKVRLLQSHDVHVPITWGVRCPVIVLPDTVSSWSDSALSFALRHELGHIRHGDALTRTLAIFVRAIYWPLLPIWWAVQSWRTVQEQASDDWVMHHGAPADAYAHQLLAAAQSARPMSFRTAPVLAMARVSTLEKRLSSLVNPTQNRRPLSSWDVSLASVLALVGILLSVAFQLKAADVAPSDKASPSLAQGTNQKSILLETRFIEIPLKQLPEWAGNPGFGDVLTTKDARQILDDVAKKKFDLLPLGKAQPFSGQPCKLEATWAAVDQPTVMLKLNIEPKILQDSKIKLEGLATSDEMAEGTPGTTSMRKHETPLDATVPSGGSYLVRVLHGQKTTSSATPEWTAKAGYRAQIFCLITVKILDDAGEGTPASEASKVAAPAINPVVIASTNAPARSAKGPPPTMRIVYSKAGPSSGEQVSKPPSQLVAEKIILPQIKLDRTPVETAITTLRQQVTEVTRNKAPFKISVDPLSDEVKRGSLTMNLKEVPLHELLRYLTELAGLTFTYQDDGVLIHGLDGPKKTEGD